MDKIFVTGMVCKKPEPPTPEFIKAKISIKIPEFLAFVETNRKDDWINIDIKEGKSGKWYAELNNYKPKDKTNEPTKATEEDIPF